MPPGRLRGLGLACARAAVGLVQGGALYACLLWRRELGAPGGAFVVLGLVAALIPIALLGGLGVLKRRALVMWIGGATVVVAGVAAYQVLFAEPPGLSGVGPPPLFVPALAAGLFVAHGLVLAAQADDRWFAGYGRYFDIAWKDGVRLGLSVAFAGAVWLVLFLGSALFGLIGISALGDALSKPWVYLPVTTTVFALGLHLTDVGIALVRGVRTLALTLLSWVLPVMVALTVGFLGALAVTGLDPLWATRNAAALLLAAAAALIILTNAAYQDGGGAGYPGRVLRWTVRLAAVLLIPLIAIAGYAVVLRVGQHGLTPERVFSGACVVVGGAYALGYGVAALWPGRWMARLEIANVAVAHLALGVLFALFSPLADPVHLSVMDQTRRLAAGEVSADAFDYDFLRFQSGRYGREALAQLAVNPPGPRKAVIAQRAREAQARVNAYEIRRLPPQARTVAVVGAPALPQSFLDQAWPGRTDPFGLCRPEASCAALIVDLDGDGVSEVVAFVWGAGSVYRLVDGRWARAGGLVGPDCGDLAQAVRAGKAMVAAPDRAWRDLMINGHRLRVTPERVCAGVSEDVTDVALIKSAPRPPGR